MYFDFCYKMQELEKCDANHFIILFRDAGCQFRSLYSYFPDSEEICKLTGTGPKSISKKMIDKLYKYSSDRKQFTVIPAKTMSVSVDALTIHNHLWQAKRPALPKKTNPLYKWCFADEVTDHFGFRDHVYAFSGYKFCSTLNVVFFFSTKWNFNMKILHVKKNTVPVVHSCTSWFKVHLPWSKLT